MTRRRSRDAPRYLRHSRKGTAIAYVYDAAGKRRQITLGPYDSPESKRRYREIVSGQLERDLAAAAEAGASNPEAQATIEELVAGFLLWAEGYYRRPDGAPTSEFTNFVLAFRPLLNLYRDESAASFGPRKLKSVRDAMIDDGHRVPRHYKDPQKIARVKARKLARKTVNARVRRIKRLFRWGVENELVPVAVWQALQAVSGLREGRTPARDTAPVTAVEWERVEATLPFLTPSLQAMVLLLRHTGARPGELCAMQRSEVDTSSTPWVYRPEWHKNAHRRQSREVVFGPKARAILGPYLFQARQDACVFSPELSEQERSVERRASRRSPLTPSQRARRRTRTFRLRWKTNELGAGMRP